MLCCSAAGPVLQVSLPLSLARSLALRIPPRVVVLFVLLPAQDAERVDGSSVCVCGGRGERERERERFFFVLHGRRARGQVVVPREERERGGEREMASPGQGRSEVTRRWRDSGARRRVVLYSYRSAERGSVFDGFREADDEARSFSFLRGLQRG